MRAALALTLAAFACDPPIDAHPHVAPCPVPPPGDTCPHGVADVREAVRLLHALVECRHGYAPTGGRLGERVEIRCATVQGGPQYLAGAWTADLGLLYPTPGGALVHCDPAGRVGRTYPLLSDGLELWVGLDADSSACLDDHPASCWVESETCEPGGAP